ncbi:MAG: hypothetical protein VB050_06320 [Geobacteraceae bacterium]|nr:hypothetical protein [Geobacteraceae bacterium]
MDHEQRILPVIFISSSASLAFKALLTCIYSISVSNHYAAMIVSIAMLGLAASGVVLSLFPRLANQAHIGKYAMALGITISAGFLLVNIFPFDPEHQGHGVARDHQVGAAIYKAIVFWDNLTYSPFNALLK